ncbi:hypothetical protein [Burkholderia pseudomallei]|nr:hypothetical protein [Burkholderia pseudomallei]
MPRLLPIGGGASTPKRMLAMPARPPILAAARAAPAQRFFSAFPN